MLDKILIFNNWWVLIWVFFWCNLFGDVMLFLVLISILFIVVISKFVDFVVKFYI